MTVDKKRFLRTDVKGTDVTTTKTTDVKGNYETTKITDVKGTDVTTTKK